MKALMNFTIENTDFIKKVFVPVTVVRWQCPNHFLPRQFGQPGITLSLMRDFLVPVASDEGWTSWRTQLVRTVIAGMLPIYRGIFLSRLALGFTQQPGPKKVARNRSETLIPDKRPEDRMTILKVRCDPCKMLIERRLVWFSFRQ